MRKTLKTYFFNVQFSFIPGVTLEDTYYSAANTRLWICDTL